MNPTYSICITHYNNIRSIRASLESILCQIDSDFEVVVADNYSNDGSEKVLQEYASEGKLRLVVIRVRCRGVGRQVAFECSKGSIILANLDMDDICKPRLREVLDKYHQRCEGNLLWARSKDPQGFWGGGNLTVAPRDLLLNLGGWRDLQYGEDWELVRRAAAARKYQWTDFQLIQGSNPHPERTKSFVGRMRYRYARYRDLLRCGRPVFEKGETISVAQRVPYVLAKLAVPFLESYQDTIERFDPYGEEYFTPFEA